MGLLPAQPLPLLRNTAVEPMRQCAATAAAAAAAAAVPSATKPSGNAGAQDAAAPTKIHCTNARLGSSGGGGHMGLYVPLKREPPNRHKHSI